MAIPTDPGGYAVPIETLRFPGGPVAMKAIPPTNHDQPMPKYHVRTTCFIHMGSIPLICFNKLRFVTLFQLMVYHCVPCEKGHKWGVHHV